MKLRALLLGLALAGCSGGDSLTELEGIYEISEWTENEEGCDVPGASILADQSQTFMFVNAIDFFGEEFISVAPCLDLQECRTDVEDNTISLSGFAFEDGSDSSGWRGTGSFLGGSDTCSGELYDDRMESVDGETVVVTRRGTAVDNVPLDSDGFCDSDAARAMAANLPCTSLEQITATLTEAL